MSRRPFPHRFRTLPGRSRQRGVYALEWAIIFPVFFMLLYAIISYGLTFLVRESMQWAAEDGARAVLRYQPTLEARFEHARNLILNERLDWLPAALKPAPEAIRIQICQVGSGICSPQQSCGMTVAERCVVQVDFTVPYGAAPLTPGLEMFGMQLLHPDTMHASASVLVDRGGL
ncbi:pilus assembly protein TadE [Lampropedia cohaerens]|uniref:Pilus assembly protein TadE n=1 Tax=Lampropedia cohaerens TaxID=1610491 RepID=A0A0U1Q2K3_9BURK|nr:TadE/TadG family type IV pilus assembly protein [Lampropedia cohaerens]KKW68981.1 pilus assembly protein TadE [Lampropedia cohaerens]